MKKWFFDSTSKKNGFAGVCSEKWRKRQGKIPKLPITIEGIENKKKQDRNSLLYFTTKRYEEVFFSYIDLRD